MFTPNKPKAGSFGTHQSGGNSSRGGKCRWIENKKIRICRLWHASNQPGSIVFPWQHSVRCRCVRTAHVVRAFCSAHLAGDITAV